ncbi:YbfB/YjiJ family MFS transporter [Ferrovibrio sp.]|uniref:YbfB/YjiJ family MFS transporter n=1 Tax=Ferrovibrio sp. TaxID=1917215 RepID=UPI003D286CCE
MTLTRFLLGALPGTAALLIGIGMARFGYTPLIPALIQDGWLQASEAVYLGATNLTGYLFGSMLSYRLATRFGAGPMVRLALVLTTLSFIVCALPLGFWWFVPWRFMAGFTGAMLMIIALPIILVRMPLDRRARAAGVVFTGVGIGVAASGSLVPSLAAFSVSAVWLGMALVSGSLTLITWRSWVQAAAPVAATSEELSGKLLSRPIVLLLLAYGFDSFGFVPHTVFWVDFVARGLGRGLAEGGFYWVCFGVGALCGPLAAGFTAEKLGFHRALIIAFLLKSFGIFLPLLSTSVPALMLSPFLAGAFAPGISAILSGRVAELVGLTRHRQVWGWMTVAVGAAQACGGYSLSYLFTQTHSYMLQFLIGGTALAIGAVLVALSGSKPRTA